MNESVCCYFQNDKPPNHRKRFVGLVYSEHTYFPSITCKPSLKLKFWIWDVIKFNNKTWSVVRDLWEERGNCLIENIFCLKREKWACSINLNPGTFFVVLQFLFLKQVLFLPICLLCLFVNGLTIIRWTKLLSWGEYR